MFHIPTLKNYVLVVFSWLFSVIDALKQQYPTFLAPGISFMGDNLSADQGWGDFGMNQVYYIV